MAHSHTPRNRCVRFVFGITAASRNTRFQAARYGLTWAGLAPADRASFAGAFPCSITLRRPAVSGSATSGIDAGYTISIRSIEPPAMLQGREPLGAKVSEIPKERSPNRFRIR